MRASIKSNISFSLATPADDPAIRRLLRDNPMPGIIFLSLEREPNYFADAHQPGESKQTIVARESGRIVCVGNCTTRLRFVNGQPRRVGYLGGLRLDASVAGRFDILRRGYDFFREQQSAAPADFYFTSIAADNHRARTFLERNLRGMPCYEFLGEFVTLLLPTERRSHDRLDANSDWQRAEQEIGASQRAAALNAFNQPFQLAPHWTAEQLTALRRLGLRDGDWLGKTARWDQRCFKQTVIRGYAPWLTLLRPVINLVARLTGKPGLPDVGHTLSHALVLHLATGTRSSSSARITNHLHAEQELRAPDADLNFIQHLRTFTAQRGIEWLTLGFAANDPRLLLMRQHFSGREYRSRLYLVHWPGLGGAAADLDHRILAPEVALL